MSTWQTGDQFTFSYSQKLVDAAAAAAFMNVNWLLTISMIMLVSSPLSLAFRHLFAVRL